MKKLLAVMMLMPMVALADKETVDGIEWTYTIKDGKAEVVPGLSTKTKGAITIPSTLGGCPVTSIGFEAFADCNGLTSVTIPLGVVRICDFAFPDCDGLKDLIIASSVTNISDNAFNGSCGLMLFSVDPANPVYSSRNGLLCSKDGSILIAGGNGDVTIPSAVTSIRTCAFTCHHGLKSVTIPASVTNIDFYAFGGCSGLMSFSVDSANPVYSSRNGLLCSKDGSALICGLNGDVTIPASVTKIEEGMFEGCSRLMSFSVESGNPAFSARNGLLCTKNGDSLVVGVNGDVTIPPSVTSIRSCAFACYDGLKTVGIPSSVTNIGHGAFLNCWALESVTIPDGVTSIESRVFENCEKLKEMTIPTNVTRIGFTAFLGCRGLTSMTIPSRVKNIERGAFSRCYELVSVTMRGERPKTKGEVFSDCRKLTSIHVPSKAKSWAGMKTWQGIPLVFDEKVGDYTWSYCVKDGEATIVAEAVGKYSCAVSPKPTGPISIPSTLGGVRVVGIGSGAFGGCSNLTSVTIPSSVKNIGGQGMFVAKRLQSGRAGDAFLGCSALSSFDVDPANAVYSSPNGLLCSKDGQVLLCGVNGNVTIPLSVTSVRQGAFYKCKALTSVDIPLSVTNIGDCAFFECSELASVTVPASVTNIGWAAFFNCPKLKSVDVVRDGKVAHVPFKEFRKLERSLLGGLGRLLGERLLGGRNRNEAGRRMGSLRERRALRDNQREDAAKAAEAAKQKDADAAKKAEGGR